jgi:hypothetical protein
VCLFVPFRLTIVLSVLLQLTASDYPVWYLQLRFKKYMIHAHKILKATAQTTVDHNKTDRNIVSGFEQVH